MEEFSAGSDAAAWVEGRSIGAYPEPTRKTKLPATISAKMAFSGRTGIFNRGVLSGSVCCSSEAQHAKNARQRRCDETRPPPEFPRF